MTIYLVRHGLTDWNVTKRWQGREDIPLNADGIAQAENCARYLAELEWRHIVSSPLSRALRTAEIIAEARGVEVIASDGFIERDYGKASGMTVSQRTFDYPDGVVPDIEPIEEVRERTMAALRAYAEQFGEDFVVVSHGGAINAILAVISRDEMGTGKTYLLNGAVNVVDFADGVFSVREVNIVP